MRPFLALLLFALPAAAAPVPKGVKRPSDDGLWRLVEYRRNGEAVPAGSPEWDCKFWRVDGDRMTAGQATLAKARKESRMFTLRRRDSDNPALREMVWDGETGGPSAAFELRGDKLLFCVANNDGTVVTGCQPAQGVYYHVFERVKEK